jgi:hypothetical protein
MHAEYFEFANCAGGLHERERSHLHQSGFVWLMMLRREPCDSPDFIEVLTTG